MSDHHSPHREPAHGNPHNVSDSGKAVTSEPLFSENGRGDQHAHDSSSEAPARADHPKLALRSVSLWLVFLLTIATFVVVAFMAFRRHPVDGGHIRGPGDEAAPNAPPDYKQRMKNQ